MDWQIKPNYSMCPDSHAVLRHFDEAPGAFVLEVGANDEHLANLFSDHGYRVLGIDLLDHRNLTAPVNYLRLKGDFCKIAELGILPGFDAIVSTSAIEHFGLGTYGGCPGLDYPPGEGPFATYDTAALEWMWKILLPEGRCYITVPYGRKFISNDRHWRVYDRASLERITIKGFDVLVKEFFWSDKHGVLATETEADAYSGDPPHCAVMLKMKKVGT